MNEEISYNEIQSFSEDWMLDERVGLPYSGQSVQKFIKDNFNNKITSQYFDPTTYILYSFKDEESKMAWIESGDSSLVLSQTPFTFTGVVNQLKLISEMGGTTLYYTTTSNQALIKTSFISQQKGLTDTNWEEIFEDFYVTVAVDKGSTGSYNNIVENQLVLNGNIHEVDVKKYIANGSNRVRITATGITTGTTSNLIYNVTLTSMYLSPSNFAWHIPFIEGSEFVLGGMLIGGSLSKTLNIQVTGENYSKLYNINIGTSTYTTNPYFFKGLEFPGQTGVYNIDIWLNAANLESDHLNYNIMCVASIDELTAQLVVMNERVNTVTNYADNTLFYYSCYNSGASTASPSVSIMLGSEELSSETLIDVTTMSKQAYITNLEIESEATDMTLDAIISYGSTSDTNTCTVDNSASYPAIPGASFYMNAATRSNAQENREKLINLANNSEIDVKWTNLAWTDGTDGHNVDNNGRKCLHLPATTKADIDYKPLGSMGSGKTIELLYKVSNAADYNEPIISICDDPTSPKFKGILIKPNSMLVHSRDLNVADNVQGYNMKDEEVVHMVITIVRNYKTTYGNFCIIYVNGVKKATFTFETSDNWTTDSNIILGSNTADLYLYKMRVYDKGFGFQDVLNNYINSLPSSTEKIAATKLIESVIDDSYNIDYMKVKDSYNTMVVEMIDGAELPHYGLNKEYKAKSNLWINIFDEDPKKVAQFGALSGEYLNQNVSGQGTTSMNYWVWNLRWKDTPIRITAKKNYASSMQDHKMGATGAYNDLHDLIVGPNEANTRTAVYQYPCYGFQKIKVEGTEDQYTYKFIGLYSIGPDKGDKNTFGMKDATYKKQLMYMEGTDHSIKGVGMEYPYSEMKYVADEESLCADRGNNQFDAAWEVAASPYDDEADIQAFLDQEFKPAYELTYNCSTMIMGTSESIENINRDVDAWGLRTDEDGHAFQRFQFWIDGEYDLYFLSLKTGKYEKDGCNLLTQLNISESDLGGLSIKEKNELFKNKRREIFKANAANYWHLDDSIFCYAFLVLFGATDNFKKNSYPYKFPLLANGGRWRWRQDDLDTIFDIDNQGHPTKHYAIEAHDWSDDSKTAYVFKGEDSVFWRLLEECFPEEIKLMGSKILQGMYTLSDSGATTIDRLIGFIKKYFWNKAQLYFTKSAYNIDAEFSYEDSYPHYKDGSYDVDVNPLEQSLGDHYEAEWAWVEKRLIYTMSKFGFGPFKEYTDTCLGRINFRTQLAQSFTLTPAMDMFPTILSGQGSASTASQKIEAGEEVVLSGVGGTNTNVYIMAADYMRSLGDLSGLTVDASTNASISIASKRLQDIKVGDENPDNVTSNLQTLAIGNCPSVSVIDARNLKSLTGAIDLTGCPRLQQALFGGTDVRSITLSDGSKISKLQLSDATTVLSLSNLKFLENENLEYGSLDKVEFFRIEKCEQLNPFQLLKNIYESDYNNLKDIRVIGFVYEGDARDIDMLANMATDLDKNGEHHIYNGIDAEGNPTNNILPVIEGTLNIDGSIYKDTGDLVKKSYPGIILNVANGYYVRFKDDTVQEIVAQKWGDGMGVRLDQLSSISEISNEFSGNETITQFPEFEYFTGLTEIPNSAFRSCYNLESLNIPDNITKIGGNAFEGNFKLNLTISDNITSIGDRCFANSGLSGRINLPNLTELGQYGVFYNTNIESIDNLGSIEKWGDATASIYGLASSCEQLKSVILPETITSIEGYSFWNDSSLTSINLPISINKIGRNAFLGCSSLELEQLNLPNLSTLDLGAFQESGIKSVLDLGSVDIIGQNAFYQCSKLESVILPETVTTINKNAFQGCVNLVSINLPESISIINDNAFYGCNNLEFDDISLPNLTELGRGSFCNVNINKISNLGQLVKLPDSNSSSVTYGNPNVLLEINIPESISKIPTYSFYNYKALQAVNLSNNITDIDKYAFYGCLGLDVESLSLPNLSNLGDYAFSGSGVKSISNLGNLKALTRYSFHNCKDLQSVNLGDITILNEGVFSDCSSLSQIDLSNVESINNYALSNCESLEIDELELPNLSSLGQGVLHNVHIKSIKNLGSIPSFPQASMEYGNWGDRKVLESFTIPNHITEIPTNCFYNYSALSNIDLSHVSKIGSNAFYNCSSLNIDDLSLPNLTELGKDVFYGVTINRISNLGNISVLPDATSGSQHYGLKSKLTNMVIPSNITEIPAHSFYNYNVMTECDLHSNITKIGENAFNLCKSLIIEDLDLPNLTDLGAAAFKTTLVKKVSNLGSITKLNNSSNVSDSGVFAYCSSLNEITLPDTLTEIGNYSFKLCVELLQIIAPDSVSIIGKEAFRNCSKLSKVYLGTSTAYIGSDAFNYCSKLDTLVCMATTPPTIDSNTFNNTNATFKVYVPDDCVDVYKSASNWLAMGDRIVGISTLTEKFY